MREFFKGWRRKVGCVALVMALALMTGWLRSQFVFDDFNIRAGTMNSFSIESKRQSLCFCWVQDNSESKSESEITIPFWMTHDPSIRGTEVPLDQAVGEFRWLSNLSDEYPRGIILSGPYWSVTMPLTLLSAYLLLWNPRQRGLLATDQSG